MSNQSASIARLEREAIQLAAQLGFEYIDLELLKEPAGKFLRLYIDKAGGITLNDLEDFHRKILPSAEDVDYDYMEVSSPGVDRPIKKPADFIRAKGALVEVKFYKPLEGVKSFQGTLVGLENEEAVVLCGETEKRYPMKQIAVIKPVIDVEDELQTGDPE